jgi:hypothetical protein
VAFRTGFVDVSAFVSEMWLSAFVLMFILQVELWKPPRAGEVLPKFSNLL